MSKDLYFDQYERMSKEEKRLAWEYIEKQYEELKNKNNGQSNVHSNI